MFSTLLEAPGWPNMAIMQGKNRNAAFDLLSNAMFRVPGGPCLGQRPAPLAGVAPSATVAVGNAGEVKAAQGDGHTLRAVFLCSSFSFPDLCSV